MFYYIYENFNVNLFGYLTVRAGFSFFLAFIFSMYFLPKFIKRERDRKISQPIYELAPENHKAKHNTPTMGGIIFIACALIATILSANLENLFVLLGIFCLGGFSLLGFIDDKSKILGSSNHAGLSPRVKFVFQILLSLFIALILFFALDFNTNFYLPSYKFPIFDLKYFSIVFWVLVIVSASNAVNLTDGLDGLATVPGIFALLTLSIFAYLMGNAVYSSYLFLPKIEGLGEIIVLGAALVGAMMAFLWFNCYPAEIFMGDSGSLALGAFIGYLGIITKNEIALILIGLIFVVETLSVILQVGSFKIFGKRIFLMAPLHHHFEIKGWNENKIIIRFWMIALLANIIALASIKLR